MIYLHISKIHQGTTKPPNADQIFQYPLPPKENRKIPKKWQRKRKKKKGKENITVNLKKTLKEGKTWVKGKTTNTSTSNYTTP